jgi:hypothetical protein
VELSPFPHQGPLDPAAVVGRDDLIEELIERVTSRRVTALLGPRRFGKTSVLRRVADDLAAAGTSSVWIDAYETTSTTDLAIRIEAGMGQAAGAVASELRERAASVGISLGVLRAEFSRSTSRRPEPTAVLHALLDTLVAAAARHPTVVVFDEFGGIFGVKGAAGLLRTKLQHHFEEIGLLFAGSQPTLMREMFSVEHMPFYAQADLIEIEPFDAATTERVVADGFAATGRAAGPVGSHIYEFTRGHPYRVMQAADACWRRTEPGETATGDTWLEARRFVRNASRLGHEAMFSTFSPSERSVLRLLAAGRALFGNDAELLGLSSSSAYGSRDRLVGAGIVRADEERFVVVDPVFADWITERVGF